MYTLRFHTAKGRMVRGHLRGAGLPSLPLTRSGSRAVCGERVVESTSGWIHYLEAHGFDEALSQYWRWAGVDATTALPYRSPAFIPVLTALVIATARLGGIRVKERFARDGCPRYTRVSIPVPFRGEVEVGIRLDHIQMVSLGQG